MAAHSSGRFGSQTTPCARQERILGPALGIGDGRSLAVVAAARRVPHEQQPKRQPATSISVSSAAAMVATVNSTGHATDSHGMARMTNAMVIATSRLVPIGVSFGPPLLPQWDRLPSGPQLDDGLEGSLAGTWSDGRCWARRSSPGRQREPYGRVSSCPPAGLCGLRKSAATRCR